MQYLFLWSRQDMKTLFVLLDVWEGILSVDFSYKVPVMWDYIQIFQYLY